jgi:two-component system OmpR family response regulator
MRILIAENDASLAMELSRILEGEGYIVDVNSRGEEAAAATKGQHFDLMILDLGLPTLDGFEILRVLRASGHDLPVLVLTARDTVSNRVRALDLGADDYLAKPFSMPELIARVQALIRRSQAHSGPKIVHGPLTVDTLARRAYLGDKPLELSPREWAILEVLLGRVEKVVSKERIIQAIAGRDDEVTPSAIQVYISRLRAKLQPAGITIRSRRGFGYMLEEIKPN